MEKNSAVERFLPPEVKTYCIRKGYTIRGKNEAFDDTPYTDEFQNDVYLEARRVLAENDYRGIVDIGCGSGFKLLKYFSDVHTVGIDITQTVKWLRAKYPFRIWLDTSLHKEMNFGPQFEMAIASDMIEHLIDPDLLMNFIHSAKFKRAIISTPERDLLAEAFPNIHSFNGPPTNKHHVREWNSAEFQKYISQFYEIERHYIVDKFTQIVEIKCQR